MGRITIVIYRPKPGREKALLKLIDAHMPVLRSEKLITDREPIVMQSNDGCVVEVFEWKSVQAIADAHENPAIKKLWDSFSKVCDYEIPSNISEFQNVFSEFTPIN